MSRIPLLAVAALLLAVPSVSAVDFALKSTPAPGCNVVDLLDECNDDAARTAAQLAAKPITAQYELGWSTRVAGPNSVAIGQSSPRTGLTNPTPAVTTGVLWKAVPIQTTTEYHPLSGGEDMTDPVTLNNPTGGISEAWNIVFEDVTTGTGGFSVGIGVAGMPDSSNNCELRMVSADVPVAGSGVAVSIAPTLAFTINEGESLVLRVRDLTEVAGSQRATTFGLKQSVQKALDGTPLEDTILTNYLTTPILPPAYPIPGPEAFMVMALGGVLVAGFVARTRRTA